MIYSVDTNVLIDLWRRTYPKDIFNTLWVSIENLIDNGDIVASDEVLKELEKNNDDLFKWAKSKAHLSLSFEPAIQAKVSMIMSTFPRMVNTQTMKSVADPFVIAVAMVHGCTVITGEKLTGNTDKPKIPDVCKYFNIPCVDILGLIRQNQWRF